VLSDSKQSIVLKKQSVVFLQQLKLILKFNHEQKKIKANDINHFKKIFNHVKELLKIEIKNRKRKVLYFMLFLQ